MRICVIMLTGLLWCAAVTVSGRVSATTATSAPAASDASSGLDRLTDREKCVFILAMLDARERSLRNFSYKAHRTVTNIARSTGVRRFMFSEECEFRRLGPKHWLHMVHSQLFKPGSIQSVFDSSWNGSSAKGIGYPPYVGTDYPQGVIRPKENDNFEAFLYNQALGFRIKPVVMEPVTVAEWVRDSLGRADDQIHQLSVRKGECNGAPAWGVDIFRDPEHRTCWVDPSRDFMIVGLDYWLGREEPSSKVTLRVTEAKRISGVWIPMHVVEHRRDPKFEEAGEDVYTVDEFRIGGVTDADVTVRFPPGTRVVDAVQKGAYVVRADGTFDLKPLADPGAHVVHVPIAPTTNRVETGLSRAYKSAVLSPGPVAVAGPPPAASWIRRIAIGLTAAIVLAGAALWLRSRWAVRR